MIVVKARLTRHPDVVRQWFLGKLFRRLGGGGERGIGAKGSGVFAMT